MTPNNNRIRRFVDPADLPIVIRGTWGTILLLAPRRITAAVDGPAGRRLTVGARVLGARHLLETVLLARRGDCPPPQWSIAVDAVHSVSMFSLGAIMPRLRRAAFTSATVAAGLVVLSSRLGCRPRSRGRLSGRRCD